MKKSGLVGMMVVGLSLMNGCAVFSDNARPTLLGGDADLTLIQNRSSKNMSKIQDSTNGTNSGDATGTPSGGSTITLDPTQLAGLVRAASMNAPREASVPEIITPEPISTRPAYRVPNRVYRVEEGDNLWTIARRFGTTVDDLQKANGMKGDMIHPGQLLTLP